MVAEVVLEKIFGVLLFLLLGIIGVSESVNAWRKFRLSMRGEWIDADLVGAREDEDEDGRARFYPVVAFTPAGSEEIIAESPNWKSYPPKLEAFSDEKVRVLYDPVNPQSIEIAGYRGDGRVKTAFIALALFATAVALFAEMVL
ncbi:DUF3592 domain-containing protein [Streptomyces sp. NPDC059096]|uniref:DUF3592 domain-containing protein n=1 Tax=Streptomyces sp. NPDC059096 TaxID=3346727 RepID=UPI0036AC301D